MFSVAWPSSMTRLRRVKKSLLGLPLAAPSSTTLVPELVQVAELHPGGVADLELRAPGRRGVRRERQHRRSKE
jgi:hypothetical protein